MIPLIAVLWIDASQKIDDTWYTKEQLQEYIDQPNDIISVGILVGVDKEMITLASCYDGDNFSNLNKIPISAIKGIYALNKGAKKNIKTLKVMDLDDNNDISFESIK